MVDAMVGNLQELLRDKCILQKELILGQMHRMVYRTMGALEKAVKYIHKTQKEIKSDQIRTRALERN